MGRDLFTRRQRLVDSLLHDRSGYSCRVAAGFSLLLGRAAIIAWIGRGRQIQTVWALECLAALPDIDTLQYDGLCPEDSNS